MWDDMRLVVVDVPGINGSHSGSLHLNYTEKARDSLNCVIIVMEAHTGVNIKEQVELLKLSKTTLEKQKEIYIIILCNNVDGLE